MSFSFTGRTVDVAVELLRELPSFVAGGLWTRITPEADRPEVAEPEAAKPETAEPETLASRIKLNEENHESNEHPAKLDTRSEPNEPAVAREKKRFEFRTRLRHEPLEGCDLFRDYNNYLHFDAVQKKFKEGLPFKKNHPKDLEWKTTWMDLFIEDNLLHSYIDWAFAQADNAHGSEVDEAFYLGLWDNICDDQAEVDDEFIANNEKHGKTKAQADRLREFCNNIKMQEYMKRKQQKQKAREQNKTQLCMHALLRTKCS